MKSSDIVKGFKYAKDKYVIVSSDDIEKIKTEKDKTIKILHFANLNQINPVYYEKTYHAVPELGGEKAFELLRSAMMEEQKIAIAKTVLGTKDTLLTLIPREDGILIQTMFYDEEIKELPKSYPKQPVNEAELTMAKTLISSMDKPFDPSLYHDEYQVRLKELISQKIEGKDVVAASPESTGNVIDLMEALQKSIKENGKRDIDKKKAGA